MRGVNARVYTHGQRLALGASTTAAHWIGDSCLFALGDGQVVSLSGGEFARTQAHDGAILCAALHPDGMRLLTGGDDGRLAVSAPGGGSETLAQLGRKWIDHVAAHASGLIVAAQGKEAAVFKPGAQEPSHRFTYPSSIGGLALDNKGRRLAASHYNGVTLRYALLPDDQGTTLKWAGSHLGITFAPEGDYVITAMQEFGLHGWRLADRQDLRMSGYPAKTRSFSWDKRGRWLASSGADCAVVWPFSGKTGPLGKAPAMIGKRADRLATCVAFHPRDEMLAIGYDDGAAKLFRLEDGAEVELDEPGEGAVTALAWNGAGTRLALGDEAGRGGLIDLA